MELADGLAWLSERDMTGAVRRLTGDDEASVTGWAHERLVGGGGEGIGVWRITGDGTVRGTTAQWSIVLKGWGAPPENTAPTAFNWPYREVELYGSGFLADLPGGVRAPACFGTLMREDGSSWAWLEDITTTSSGPESMRDYALIARCLGRFNGAYLDGTPRPHHAGLSEHWLRQWVEAAGPSLDLLTAHADHALLRQLYPPDITEVFRRLWVKREGLLEKLGQLPQTLCHLDAFRRNAFVPDIDGPDDIILIDWSFTGPGHLGEELAPLVVASGFFMDVLPGNMDDLQEITLVSYIEGLRDRGWQGNDAEVRDAYLITAALRYGLGAIRPFVSLLLDPETYPGLEQMVGHTINEMAAHTGTIHGWIAGMVRERADLFDE